jgi:hypothetical protein
MFGNINIGALRAAPAMFGGSNPNSTGSNPAAASTPAGAMFGAFGSQGRPANGGLGFLGNWSGAPMMGGASPAASGGAAWSNPFFGQQQVQTPAQAPTQAQSPFGQIHPAMLMGLLQALQAHGWNSPAFARQSQPVNPRLVSPMVTR